MFYRCFWPKLELNNGVLYVKHEQQTCNYCQPTYKQTCMCVYMDNVMYSPRQLLCQTMNNRMS